MAHLRARFREDVENELLIIGITGRSSMLRLMRAWRALRIRRASLGRT